MVSLSIDRHYRMFTIPNMGDVYNCIHTGLVLFLFFLKGVSSMKKSLISTLAISLLALVLVAVMFFANSNIFAAHASTDNDIMIHVIEHANTDTVGDMDNGKPAPDALGNVLAFHNPVFDVADQKQVVEGKN